MRGTTRLAWSGSASLLSSAAGGSSSSEALQEAGPDQRATQALMAKSRSNWAAPASDLNTNHHQPATVRPAELCRGAYRLTETAICACKLRKLALSDLLADGLQSM